MLRWLACLLSATACWFTPTRAEHYLNVQSTGALSLPVRVWSSEAFISEQPQPLLWIFCGLSLAMLVYNLFSYAALRETAYLHFVGYVASYFGLQLSLHGFAYCGLGFSLLLQRDFLRLWEDFPRLARASKSLGLISFVLGAGSGLVPDAIGGHVLGFWGASVVSFSLIVTGLALSTRSRAALYYAVSSAALLAGGALYWLGDSAWSVVGPELGASIQLTVLSVGLADRMHVMRANLQRLSSRLTQNVEHLTQALEQAGDAARAKRELVASVSQELRTPLDALLHLPEDLLEDFREAPALGCRHCHAIFALDPGEQPDTDQPCPQCQAELSLVPRRSWIYAGNPEEAVRRLSSIHKASTQLLHVVSAILDLSELETARVQLSLTEIFLPQLLEDTLSPLRRLAQSKGTQLALLACSGDCKLRGDPVRIAQVVATLVSNAIKLSDGSGEVSVWASADADSCELFVRERGLGVAPADQPPLLEPSHARPGAGAALGLSISKRLVELHGGRLWVESELGAGSTCHVRLPKAGPSPSEPAPPRYSTRAPEPGLSHDSAQVP